MSTSTCYLKIRGGRVLITVDYGGGGGKNDNVICERPLSSYHMLLEAAAQNIPLISARQTGAYSHNLSRLDRQWLIPVQAYQA